MDKSGQGGSSGREGGQTGDAAPLTDLPLAARELMEGYTPPAGRGGLSYVKEEDASRDPRLAKFLGPLTAPQPPSHTRDAGDGEAQMNGVMVNGIEINAIAETEREGVDLRRVDSGMSEEDGISGSGTEEQIKETEIEEEDERDMKESSPLLPDLQCSQASTDDALEEIVPLDQLDAYIKEMHMNRRCTTTQKGKKEMKKGKEEEEKRCGREKKGREEEKRCVKEKKEREVEKEVVERGRTETEPQQEVEKHKRVDRKERKEIRSQREADGNKSGGVDVQEEMTGMKEHREVQKTQENNTLIAEKETKMMADSSTTSVDNIDDKINEKDYDDDESFDLDLSDYDSDNDKLDLALEEWRNDCGGGKLAGEPASPVKGGNKKAKGGKREGFRLWRKEPKDSGDDVELPSALQALLDKATTASMDAGGDGNTGWTM